MEAEPAECQSKPFSTHSGEAKDWARMGADLIAHYLMNHGMFFHYKYFSADKIQPELDESGESFNNEIDNIPKIYVDRSGNPWLPDQSGLKLKSQQLLVREIFKKAYSKHLH